MSTQEYYKKALGVGENHIKNMDPNEASHSPTVTVHCVRYPESKLTLWEPSQKEGKEMHNINVVAKERS